MDALKQYLSGIHMDGDPEVLQQARAESRKAFMELSFPGDKHEEWRYTPVDHMAGWELNYNPLLRPTEKELPALPLHNYDALAVTLNGSYKKYLSKPGGNAFTGDLSEAIAQGKKGALAHFNKLSIPGNEVFTHMNTAFGINGVYVEAGKETSIVLCVHITDVRPGKALSLPRTLVYAPEGSRVTVIEYYLTLGQGQGLSNAVTELVADPKAVLHHYKIVNETSESHHIGNTWATADKEAQLKSVCLNLNGELVRNNLYIALKGEYAHADLIGLYFPNGTQHVDNHTAVDHAVPNCTSNELYKGIVDGEGVAVFNGKIYVRPDAQKTQAYQSCKNVLLSDKGSVNTKPQLEIWADDVKCSHGTTTGRLDEEALFYMQARGISKEKARNLLIQAFLNDVAAYIEHEELKNYITEAIAHRLGA